MLRLAFHTLMGGRRKTAKGVFGGAIGLLVTAVFLMSLTPGFAWACACGCGIYEVGTASLFPKSAGGTAWLEYDYQDQSVNWHGAEPASKNANSDKRIRTHFLTLGAQYMFNRKWGVMLEVPYWYRYFRTTNDDGDEVGTNFNSIGDIRIEGMYTGLSEDMSTGILGGVKVPSGWWTYPHADRDTQIGTGSTDLLFGAYQLGTFPSRLGSLPLTFRDRSFHWFAQVYYDLPVWTQQNYTPGSEFDGALGAYYNFGAVAFLKELAPMVTFLGSDRAKDQGMKSNHPNSGYDRVLVAPGAEIGFKNVRLYGDVEVPFFQDVVGDQLMAPVLFKTILSYDF